MAHLNQVTTALALQNVDLHVHRRKFSLVVQGLEGPPKEVSIDTREAVIDMAKNKLGVRACDRDLAACHRLKPTKDAGIIARFVDLGERDKWLANAKHLKDTKISVAIDVPPCLRRVKKQLVERRKSLPLDVRKRCYIKHLPSWPYLELRRPNPDNPAAGTVAISHSFTKEMVALAALEFEGDRLEYVIPKNLTDSAAKV